MMSTMGLIYLVVGVIISSSTAEYALDDTDPSVPLVYDTVTEIIEAFNTEEPDALEQDPDMEQVSLSDIIYDYVYENHPDTLQKRSGHYSYRKRKAPKRFYPTKAYYPEPTEEPEVLEHDSEELESAAEEYEVPLVEEPCEVPNKEETIEYTSAEDSYGYVGSLRGKPGLDYPNYKEIPLTSFTCADKEYIPGFYADPETRCQVFHVCYPHRRESFLCPVGTTFNQPIKACDYWYNGNCSSVSEHYDVNEIEPTEEISEEDIVAVIEELFPSETEPPVSEVEQEVFSPVVVEPEVTLKPIFVEPEVTPKPVVIEVTEVPLSKPVFPKKSVGVSSADVTSLMKFLPVKAKVKKFKVPLAVGKTAVKAKTVLSSAVKAKVPMKVHAKVSKAKIAFPLKAIPVAKVLKTIPIKKAAVANKVFLAKAKIAAPVVKPLLFKKAVAGNSLLFKKAKISKAKKAMATKVAVPFVSALTKKNLALSLIKMLKAQKLKNIHGYPFRYVHYRY